MTAAEGPTLLGLGDRLKRRAVRTLMRSRWLTRRIAGYPPTNKRGDTLDLDAHLIAGLEDPLKSDVVEERRASMRSGCALGGSRGWQVEVRAETAGGRPARLYSATSSRSLLVYFHGGGWVLGGLDTADLLCRRLAAQSGWSVLSVDYRLAPEHPFPAGLHDAVGAVEWALDNAQRLGVDQVAVGGDSAGGNLTAASCLALRDKGIRPALQLLIYPATDLRLGTKSVAEFSEGPLLTRAAMNWFIRHYGAPDDDPLASPVLGELHDLPPAIVVTAGFDPLRDEGEALAKGLTAAGVRVKHLVEAEQMHGFVNMDGLLPAADAAVGRIVSALRAAT
jgi:acetyl esterase